MKPHIHKTGIVAIVLMAAMVTQAGTIADYGNWEADNVWYNQVSEDTDYGNYGAPIIAGNTLSFDTTDMDASASNGSTMENVAALSFDIQAKAGNYVAGVDFAEGGNFSLTGIGTDATSVDVTANFTVSILQVDGVNIAPVSESIPMTFLPNADGTFELATDGGGGPFYQGLWNGSIYIDLGSILDSNSVGYTSGATLAHISLDNKLTARSEAGTSSLINKNIYDALSITSDVIPEPASAALLAGAASLLALIRRRFIS